jgi:hypothetical protein
VIYELHQRERKRRTSRRLIPGVGDGGGALANFNEGGWFLVLGGGQTEATE